MELISLDLLGWGEQPPRRGHAPHTPHSAPDGGCPTWGPFKLPLLVTGNRTGHLCLLEDETSTPMQPCSSHPAPRGDTGRSQLNHPDLGFLIKPKKLVQQHL